MNRYIIPILVGFLSTILVSPQGANAQSNDEAAIRKTLNTYLEHTRSQDIPALVDDLYPGIFAILPRDQMEAYFRQFFLDEEIRFRFESMDIHSISPIFVHSGRSFSSVRYHLKMTMQYLAAERDDSVMNMLMQNMSAEYGESNVIMDAEKGSFYIQADKIMLAIRNDADPAWKVMDFDPSLQPFLDQMEIPREVIVHFGL